MNKVARALRKTIENSFTSGGTFEAHLLDLEVLLRGRGPRSSVDTGQSTPEPQSSSSSSITHKTTKHKQEDDNRMK